MPLVMKFGLLPPTANADVVEDALWKAHQYRNKLVECERERRRMIREAEEPYGIRALEGDAKELGVRLKKLRDTKDPEAKAVDAKLKDVRQELARLRETPAIVARMLEINGKPPKRRDPDAPKQGKAAARNTDKTPNNGLAAKARRAARDSSELFWGTYLCVEDAAGRSFSDTGGPYDGADNNDPGWKRWRGEGTLGIQIQYGKGKCPLDIFGSDPRVSIAPVDEIALTSPIRSERRKAARTTLRMIVAGDLRNKRNPTAVYAEWPMMLHRPIPADARITWVKVSKRMVGPRAEWSCEITLERTKVPPPTPANGTLAVVFGWRAVEGNKVRVAQWLSTTGEAGVLDLSRDENEEKVHCGEGAIVHDSPYRGELDGGRGGVISGFRRVDSLKSTRKTNFNAARDALVKWLRTLPEVPEWIRQRTTKDERVPTSAQTLAYMSEWRAPGKLAALVKTWASNRFDGDCSAFDAVEAWRYHDYHLWQWEESQSKGAARRRNNLYRVTAAHLADKHARILVDGSDFKQMREKEEREVSKEQSDKAQSMAQIVSPGIFRDAFKNAATQRGRAFDKVKAGDTAQRCPRCGAAHKAHKHVDDGMFACASCGLTREIATVRLMNMLRDDGHGDVVLEIIQRQDEVVEAMKGLQDGKQRTIRDHVVRVQEAPVSVL